MAIRIHGRKCSVCGFDFNEFYGEDLAQGYIEVHHMKKIAEGERITDPANDLAPLCANCHAMADRLAKRFGTSPMSIAELREYLIH
jgi:predicted HNH restriction endonuclease